jgi:hypothetical protein
VAAWVTIAVLGSGSASGQGLLGGATEETESSRPIVLEGLVVAADGAPVEGAIVVSSAGGQAVTDRGGRYRLEVGAPLDARSLEVTAAGADGGDLLASTRVELGAAVEAVRVAPLALAAGTCQPGWLPTFGGQPGVAGSVASLAVFDDGTGQALYVGGTFDIAGGVVANNVAKWNGSKWSFLGSGTDGPVTALTVFDDGTGPALYAGGQFLHAGGVVVNYVAKWDGSSWSALGSGVDDRVNAFAVFDDGGGPALYAGGYLVIAGGVVANYVAKWDGSAWSALGSGIGGGGVVHALTVFDDGAGPALYGGGDFTTAGGVAAKNIARWDGSAWSALGSGVASSLGAMTWVSALAVFDDGNGPRLYVGGRFDLAGGVAASRIARWDGASWSPLGSGTDMPVDALAVFDDGSGPGLYAGGRFDLAGGISASRIARWDGSAWSALGSGIGRSTGSAFLVDALAVFDDGTGPALVAGGSFNIAGGLVVKAIASWKDSTWSSLGSGLNDSVFALTVFDDGGGAALYAGGRFTSAGGAPASHVAKWDGSTWSALGGGVAVMFFTDGVEALTVFDDGSGPALYAGGSFTAAGGLMANNIARWDGTSWSALGRGAGGDVYALTVFDDGGGPALYAGGSFQTAGGVAVENIARWDGSSWSPVGNPFYDVFALAVFDDGTGPALYAGGGPVSRWDGSSWVPLGGWTSGGSVFVGALAVFDDGGGPALYAGGNFSSAGVVPASDIARWDGSSWSPLGSGTQPGSVGELAVFDDGGGPALYAGGSFTSAGGIAARYLAKWDGSTWSPLGIGTYDPPTALAAFDRGGPSLYVGSTLFAKGDSYLGRWGCIDLTPPTLSCPAVVIELDNFGTPSGETVSFTVTAEDDLDPSPDVVCTPPSGSFFPRGTTLVTCTATDASGNESTCEFPVTVQIKARKL